MLSALVAVANAVAVPVLTPISGDEDAHGDVPQAAWAAQQGRVTYATRGSTAVFATDGAAAVRVADVTSEGSELCRVPATLRWSSGHLSGASCEPDRSASDDADRGSAWCASEATGRHSLSVMLPLGTKLAGIEFAARCAQPYDRGCFQWATVLDTSVWNGRGWTRVGELSGPPQPGGGAATQVRVRRALTTVLEARVLRVTPTSWYSWPSIRVDALSYCSDIGGGTGPYTVTLHPLPGALAATVRRQGAAPRLVTINSTGGVKELWRCGPRHHAFCGGDVGAPVVASPAPGGGGLPQPLLRPAGTGQVLAIWSQSSAGTRVLRDAGEWRGTAVAAQLPSPQQLSDLAAWDEDVGEGQLAAGAPTGRLPAWGSPRLGRSRMEGAAVLRMECEDGRLRERRQLYLTYTGAEEYAGDAMLGPPATANVSWASAGQGRCSTLPDFSFALEGADCVTQAADGGTATEWGYRLGAHIRFGSEAAPAACAGTLFPDAADLRIRIDPSGHETDPRADWYAVLHGAVYFRSYDPHHGLELWAWEGGAVAGGAGGVSAAACQEAEMDGAELTVALLPQGSAFDPANFVLQLDVKPLESQSAALVAQLGSGSAGEIWAWRAGLNNDSTAGLTVPSAAGCTVDVPVGSSLNQTLYMTLPSTIGGCSSHPVSGAGAGVFSASVVGGELILARTDEPTGWGGFVTLRCWRQDCIGGAVAAAPVGVWTTLRWECAQGACSVYENGVAGGTANVTAADTTPGTRPEMSSAVYIGALRRSLSRGLTDSFRGGVRGVRLNGACLQPDATRESLGAGCRPPVQSSSGYNASAALRAASEGDVWRHDGNGSWPAYVQWAFSEDAVVSKMEWVCPQQYGCPRSMRLQRSRDGAKWVTAAAVLAPKWNTTGNRTVQARAVRDSTPAPHWRVLIDTVHGVAHNKGEAELDMLRLVSACGVNADGQTRMVADTLPGPDSGAPLGGVVLDGSLLFLAAADSQVYHVTRYNPGGGVARRVTDMYPQLFSRAAGPSVPGAAVAAAQHTAVWAVRGGLLTSDGTEHGTRFHELPPPDTSDHASHVVVLDAAADATRLAYFCGAGSEPAGRSMSDLSSATALCIASVASPHSVSVTRLHIGRGSVAPVPMAGTAVVSSPGFAGDSLEPVWRSVAVRPMGDFRALGDGGCLPAAADVTLDTAAAGWNYETGFLSVRSDGSRAAFLRFSGVTTEAAELRLRLHAVTADWSDVSGRCEKLTVDLLDPSWAWYEAGLAGGDSIGTVIGSTLAAIPGAATGPMDLDISDLVAAHKNITVGYVGAMQLRLRLDPLYCALGNRSAAYTLTLQPSEAELPAERPRVCTRGNGLQQLTYSGSPLASRPPTRSRGSTFRASLLPEAATADSWIYGSCGAATVRFKLGGDALSFMKYGSSAADGRWSRITDAQVVRGSVAALPDSVWLGNTIKVASLQRGVTFLSTRCRDGEECCNGHAPSDVDEVALESLQPRSPHRLSALPRCDAAVCAASGGVCGAEGCECPSETMTGTTGRCECSQWWFGVACDVYCHDDVTCGGKGTCNSDGACDCAAGWGGSKCTVGMTCADLKAALPGVTLDCDHTPAEVVTLRPEDPPVASDLIDRCQACIEEKEVFENGHMRYKCTFAK
eukprot:TRINITY_DN26500_c0_g1_i1.p1 TRINITY_DN26500_c0_g1~~TRINITY_DN26500_c0_g1_i1.p1  ORF type:complete len:1629 (+),score=464.01 TRINITY_DN26500_c0_g1_i1:52-4938(+)